MTRIRATHFAPAALLFALTPAFAQIAPPSAAEKDGGLITLNPFTVVGTGDKGYQAQDTLAGTRLKTSLKDIATPMTSFTQQFLEDTGITDTSDLARFMISTEYDQGEDSGQSPNSIKADAAPLRMRGVGLNNATAAPSVNFFKFAGRLDTFSIERVDQSRGPNSILFGMGSPAGIVNVTTKRADYTHDAGSISFAGKSYDGQRAVVDYNKVVVPGRLALRVAAVQDKVNSWKNYEYNDNERAFGTLKWKIAEHTELNVEGEHGRSNKETQRSFTAFDSYTPWRDAGKPIAATAVNGVMVLSTAPYYVYDTTTGQLMNWRNKTASAAAKTVDGTNTVLTDFSVLPKETSVYGPGYQQRDDYTRLTAVLTHSFTPNLNLELGAFRYDNRTADLDTQLNSTQALQVDTNATLPTGAANPNVGRAYLEGLPQINQTHTRDDSLRASLAYDHDFGKFFGKHTLAGVFQYAHENLRQWVTREQILTNPPNTTMPENNQNRVFRRTYVNLGGPSDDIVMANWTDAPTVSGLKEVLSGQTVQSAFIPFNANTQINSNRLHSGIVALQSSFWDGRIHTVYGASRDERTDYYGTQVRSTLAPFTQGGILQPIPGTAAFKNTANSVSFSGVIRTVDWLYLTYSQAANAGLPVATGQLDTPTGRPPIPRGKSRDIGIKLDLFNHRVFVTASHFSSGAKQDFDFSGVLAASINPIWNALNDAGILAANGLNIDKVTDRTTGATRDTDSEGYEVELTANPTEHWRIYANYTKNQTKITNIGGEMQDYLAANRALWTKYGNTPIAGGQGTTATTVNQQIAMIDQQVFTKFIVADGRMPLGQREHHFNLRTGYDFATGPLKGWSVGGGTRYSSRNLLRFVVTTDASNNITRTPSYGSDQIFVDGNASYTKKFQAFNHGFRWTIQLNVDNVFNNDAFVRLRENSTGQLVNYMFNPPRTWILTNRFSF